jgi:pimeloyl-ACP methyl ester carboxylesterase
LWGALALFLASQAVLLAALLYRMWRQDQYASEMTITSPDGISRAGFVNIGGIRQFIDIRGEHRSNPVLLIVSGGPGNSMVPLETMYRPWEKYFTVVEWDQRGTGKTYSENGPERQAPLTIAQYTADGIQVADYARWMLRKPRIAVLGISWGSLIGVRMVKQRPDLFSAYVGTGQVVASAPQEAMAYDTLLKKARAANDTSAVETLTRIGSPPYRSLDAVFAERQIAVRYSNAAERGIFWTLVPIALCAPNYTLTDIYYSLVSSSFASKMLYKEISAYDARKLGPDFQVPMFVFNGNVDTITPMAVSKTWFDGIRAPHKEYVVLDGGGHLALLTMPDRFLAELRARVWPVAHAADMVIVPPEHDQW